ncbi:MAG: valine--tRNA ligase [Candidatus Aenigmarchaeota archaeon]|nr:valine--tRNA ligase [Candidatus Aenigmarchaeota archaeon]
MDFQPKLKEKQWDKSIEQKMFKKWQEEGLYKFDKKSKKPLYSIDTPPPYVNTPIHIGHAYTYVWQDIMARSRRMMGFNVLFPIGLDKNGLPIEVMAEKIFNIKMHETPREEFIAKCKEMLEKAGDASLDSFKRLGLSCNEWQVKYELGGRYDTDDPEYRRLTQETFIQLWRKGLIYEDVKPTNYCPVCGTAIADAEVEYKEGKTKLNYIKFKVKETNEEIIIATTRPELLCSCKIILFNPEDQRYKHLNGKHAIVPIYGQEVEIRAHPYAKPEFGSGLVMICSFGDYGDVRLLRELNIEPTYAINTDGRMNENAGMLKGFLVADARKAIIAELQERDLLVKQEEIDHREPICWRSKNPIEFVALKEFYLKQVEFIPQLLDAANKMNFFAPESKQILIDWINSVSIDWVLTRRRYYGTEVPLWYCKKCNYIYVPDPGKYYQPWKEKPPIEKCPNCGSKEFVGEQRTFDTWFDSSSSEVYILGYLWDKKFFEKHFPCSMRPQGKEIVRNWLYYTLLKSLHLYGKPPFKECWIHMHVVDEKGEKMSKSLGNVIDPHEILDKYGAEAFRIWSCLEGDITHGDIRCSFNRIEGTSKFLTKLWNIARFVSSFPQVEKTELTDTDKWIIDELYLLVERVKNNYKNYEFSDAANDIRNFVWNVFASHYLEMIKVRAYGQGFSEKEQKSAWFTVHFVLKNVLKLLAPIIPFMTDYIWREVYDKESIHKQELPEINYRFGLENYTQKIIEFNSAVWKEKKDKGLSLKAEIAIKVPEELKMFKKDLVKMHNII